MKPDKFVAYYRVSTARQGRSGLGLEAQREAVLGYLRGTQGRLLAEFTEVESGKRNDRPELQRAIRRAKVSGARLLRRRPVSHKVRPFLLTGLTRRRVGCWMTDTQRGGRRP